MPRLRARAILLAQAERLEAAHLAHGSVALRMAVWRLDAGERPDPAVLVRGAHLARDAHDFRVVRRLIEAVPAEQLDAVGSLLLGEALYELGVFDAAERVLARGQELPSERARRPPPGRHPGQERQLGLVPARNRAGHQRGRQGRGRPSEPLVEELAADEAAVRMFSGRPVPGAGRARPITGSDRRTRVVRAIVGAGPWPRPAGPPKR